MMEVNHLADDTQKQQPAAENAENNEQQDQPMTMTEKIATAVLVGYIISLIWLAGSKHWFGLW